MSEVSPFSLWWAGEFPVCFPSCLSCQLCQEVLLHTLQESPGLFPVCCIGFPADIWWVPHEDKAWRLWDFALLFVEYFISLFILDGWSVTDCQQNIGLVGLTLLLIHKHSTPSSPTMFQIIKTLPKIRGYPHCLFFLANPLWRVYSIHWKTPASPVTPPRFHDGNCTGVSLQHNIFQTLLFAAHADMALPMCIDISGLHLE